MNGELGNIALEIFPQALRGLCEFIADYRELYWFRDLHPVNKISAELTQTRNVHVGLSRSEPRKVETPSSAQDQDRLGLIKERFEVRKALLDFDSLLAGKNLSLNFRLGTSTLTLHEDRDPSDSPSRKSPLFSLGTPAASVGLSKTGDSVKGSAFGFSFTSSRETRAVSVFVSVPRR